jgi:alanyl-tRNA synthetase
MLFKTEKQALGFIKWNGDDIDTGGGELRPYYCSGCCGYHISSHEHNTKFDGRINRMIERYKRDIKAADDMDSLDKKFVKELDEEALAKRKEEIESYVSAIDISKFHTRDEAQELYGFVLYQGGIVPGKMIRVVKIPGVDVQACAGTHVLRTGVVGPIKINKTERVQDGVERIDFSAGLAAIDSMQHDGEILRESSSIFKVENDQLPKTCDRFFSEWKAQKNEIDRLKSEIASLKMNSLADEYDEINGLKVVHQLIEADFKELQKMATDFTDNGKADVVIMGNSDGKIVGAASQSAIDSGVKINEIIKTAAGVLGGGGGGRLTLAQGAGKNTDKMDEAIQTAVDLI